MCVIYDIRVTAVSIELETLPYPIIAEAFAWPSWNAEQARSRTWLSQKVMKSRLSTLDRYWTNIAEKSARSNWKCGGRKPKDGLSNQLHRLHLWNFLEFLWPIHTHRRRPTQVHWKHTLSQQSRTERPKLSRDPRDPRHQIYRQNRSKVKRVKTLKSQKLPKFRFHLHSQLRLHQPQHPQPSLQESKVHHKLRAGHVSNNAWRRNKGKHDLQRISGPASCWRFKLQINWFLSRLLTRGDVQLDKVGQKLKGKITISYS